MRSSPGRRASDAVHVATCAEEILFLLRAHGVDHLFLNPGTDSAPLQEAAATLTTRGVPIPRMVTSSFESVALAAAHGYWQATRRPQAVFVHVDVGTQNLGAMVHDVLRDRAGVVVLAGRTPYGEDASSPGGRSQNIHWLQDVPDQAGIIRPYAKWTAELTRPDDTARVIGRAVQVAAGGRAGLAYLTLPRDVLMGLASDPGRRRVGRFARPVAPAVEPGTLAWLASQLVTAERPIVVTSRVGRDREGARALARLAEIAAIPVVGRSEAMNLPSAHPMRVRSREAAAALVREADLVVIVDCDVPWVPANHTPAATATIVQIDADPVKADMPLWTFPVDVAITADGAVALAQLADAVEPLIGSIEPVVTARRAHLRSVLSRGAPPVRDTSSASLDVMDVVDALNELLGPDDVVLEEAVSNSWAVSELIDRTEPGTLCSAGGPGLGWALGAAVGTKLARPDRRVVAVVGDGAFMFGVPSAALCLAAEASAPFLTVILDNHEYRASRLPVEDLFPDGASAALGHVIGTRFARPPDFAALAEACGAHGRRVEKRDQLTPAIREGLDEVDAGRSAVVDIAISG